MGFKLDNFGTEVANAKGTLGGICYYRYRNDEGDDLTKAGYFPANLGLNVGDRIYVIPQDASEADELWVITSIANRTVEAEKVSSGGGSAVIDELNVTPSTSAQTITPGEGVDGFAPVNVSAVDATIDANIVAGNIKDGVTILGVAGSYTGEPPTGTINITSNGTHNVSGYANASVAVPTTAPALYRAFQNRGGELVASTTESSIINLSGITNLTDYILYGAYINNTTISGTVDMSDVEDVRTQALENCFYRCTGITSVDLTSLKYWDYGGSSTFAFSGITSAVLPNVEFFSSAGYLFNDTKLTTISLPNCYSLYDCAGMFGAISTLTSANLSKVANIGYCVSLFAGDNALTTVDMSSVAVTINCGGMFANCTSLTSLSFPAFAPLAQHYQNYVDALEDAFNNIPNITVHFPSNVQSIVEGLNGYSATAPFGALSGSVLFDLPATYAIEFDNSNYLVRCPIKDTVSALAWVNPFGHDVYWTSGTTQPAVNDWLYYDENLTQQFEEITSIIQ